LSSRCSELSECSKRISIWQGGTHDELARNFFANLVRQGSGDVGNGGPSRRTATDSRSAFNSGRTGRACRGMWPDAREEPPHQDLSRWAPCEAMRPRHQRRERNQCLPRAPLCAVPDSTYSQGSPTPTGSLRILWEGMAGHSPCHRGGGGHAGLPLWRLLCRACPLGL
jgi:hypothetical protein